MKVKLFYSHERVKLPVLSTVILETGVPLNILEAKVTPSSGEIVVEIPATGEKLEKVIRALQEQGVKVQELGPAVTINVERCVLCGACVSPCPTGAIKLLEDRVEVDDSLCIRCKACAVACPFRAITIASGEANIHREAEGVF